MGFHLFPSRTEKLSPLAPMVLPKGGRVGRCQLLSVLFLCGVRRFFYALNSGKRLGIINYEIVPPADPVD